MLRILLRFLGIKKVTTYTTCNIVYMLFFQVSLLFHIGFLMYEYHETRDILDIAELCMYVMEYLLYWQLYYYFSTQNENRIYESSWIEKLPQENTILKSICFFYVLSLSVSIGINYEDVPYLISRVYGNMILVVTFHVYLFSMLQQSKKLRELRKNIHAEKMKDRKNITLLVFQIIDVRHTLSRMIGKLEGIYLIITLFGGISTGILFHAREFDMTLLVHLILFICMEVIFLYIIQYIGKERENILKRVNERTFVKHFLLKYGEYKESKEEKKELTRKVLGQTQLCFENDMEYIEKFDMSLDNLEKCIYKSTINLTSTLDYFLIKNILKEDWKSFGMFGLNFSDTASFRKAFSLTLGIVFASSNFINIFLNFLIET